MSTITTPYTTLEKLVGTLNAQKESKFDFVADSRTLELTVLGEEFRMTPKTPQLAEFFPKAGLPVGTKVLKQLSEKLDVPVPPQFLDKLMAKGYETVVQDVYNALLMGTKRSYLVRCMEDRIRAIVSDRYRILDNFDVAFSALGTVRENSGEVLSAWINDDAMSISFTTRNLWDRFNEGERKGGKGAHHFDHLKGNDDGGDSLFHPLVTIKNSETGRGGLSVRYGVLRARCVNSVIVEDAAVEKHLGGRIDWGILSQETIAEDAKVTLMKVRDAITAGFHPATFNRIVGKLQNATEVPITQPKVAVGLLSADLLSEEAKENILQYFFTDYDQTAYGLSQAVSRYAQDVDADKGDALSAIAGDIINTPKTYAVTA